MCRWVCIFQHHVVTADNYFVITNNDSTKRTPMSAFNPFISFLNCFCQEFVVSILYSCLKFKHSKQEKQTLQSPLIPTQLCYSSYNRFQTAYMQISTCVITFLVTWKRRSHRDGSIFGFNHWWKRFTCTKLKSVKFDQQLVIIIWKADNIVHRIIGINLSIYKQLEQIV